MQTFLNDGRVNPDFLREPLTKAIAKGRADSVEILLKDPRVDAVHKDNALITAANKFPEIRVLLQNHVTIKVHNIVAKGDLKEVQELIKTIDPNIGSGRILRTACIKGHTHIVQYLLSDPRVKTDFRDEAALVHACKRGYSDIVKLLLTKSPDVNARNGKALHTAVGGNHEEIVKLLLSQEKTDIKANNSAALKDCLRSSPSIFSLLLNSPSFKFTENTNQYIWPKLAKHLDHLKVFATHPVILPHLNKIDSIIPAVLGLGDQGCDEAMDFILKNTKLQPTSNDLIRALETDKISIAIKFLAFKELNPSQGSNINSPMVLGIQKPDFAIHLLNHPLADPTVFNNYAIRNAQHPQVVKLLLSNNSVNPMSNENEAICKACESGNLEMFELFMNCSKVDVGVGPVLKSAAIGGNPIILKQLLNHPKIQPSANNNIALITAVKNGNSEVVKELLNTGKVDPSVPSNLAVMTACLHNFPQVLQIILSDARVDPSVNNNFALRKSSKIGNYEIVKLLLSDSRVDPSSGNQSALRHAASVEIRDLVEVALKEKHVLVTEAHIQSTNQLKQIKKAINDNKCTKTVNEESMFQLLCDENDCCVSCVLVCKGMNINSKNINYKFGICQCDDDCACYKQKKEYKSKFHETFSLAPTSSSNITCERKDLSITEENKVIVLDKVLSVDECDFYVDQVEKLGFQSVSWEYEKDYRDSERVLIKSQSFADSLWRRIAPKITKNDIEGIKPFGFWNEGTWKPVGINPVIRFTRYNPGGHFSIHRDGMYVQNSDVRSIFTLVIYLNDGFTGGQTEFYSEEATWLWLPNASNNYYGRPQYQQVKVLSVTPKRIMFQDNRGKPHVTPRTKVKHAKQDYNFQHSIPPKKGTGILFTHDTFHKGCVVEEGTKYIIRADIMFERVDVLETRMFCEKDPFYIKAQELYQKSIQYQKEGKPGPSTECYLEALDIQASLFKSITSKDKIITQEEQIFPIDIFVLILTNLTLTDISTFRQVCRGWNRIGGDGAVWWTRFRQEWPEVASLQTKFFVKENLDQHQIFMKDWYGLYRRKHLFEHDLKVLCVDVGNDTIKFGSEDRGVGRIWCGYQTQYYHGWSAKPGVTDYYVTIIHGATDADANVVSYGSEDTHNFTYSDTEFARILDTYVKQELSYPIDSYCLLFAKPLLMSRYQLQHLLTGAIQGINTSGDKENNNDNDKNNNNNSNYHRCIQKVHVIDAPVLSLYSFGVKTGLVINCGNTQVTIAAVIDGITINAKFLKSVSEVLNKNKKKNRYDDDNDDDIEELTNKDIINALADLPTLCSEYVRSLETIINNNDNNSNDSTKVQKKELHEILNFVVLTGGNSLNIREEFVRKFGDLEPSAHVYFPEDPSCDVALGGKTYGALLNARDQFWQPENLEFPFAQINLSGLWGKLYYLKEPIKY